MSADDKYITLSSSFAATGTGAAARMNAGTTWTHQLIVDGQAGNTATAVVEGTNDPGGTTGWVTIATLSASYGSPDSAAGLLHTWLYLRHRCTALAGTAPVARVITAGA